LRELIVCELIATALVEYTAGRSPSEITLSETTTTALSTYY
jgi:hypothetical protein